MISSVMPLCLYDVHIHFEREATKLQPPNLSAAFFDCGLDFLFEVVADEVIIATTK